MRKYAIFLTVIAIFYLLPDLICAAPSTSTTNFTNQKALFDEIKQFVNTQLAEQYTGNIVTEILQTNYKTYVKQCDIPLDYSLPIYSFVGGRTTIKVICNGNKAWSSYIPINVKIYQPVVMTNRPMSKDEIITANAVTLKEIDIINLTQGFFSEPSTVIGQVVRLPLKAGNVLTPQSITKNKLVKRGDRVNITVEDPELMVYMQGESLEDGALGDNIKVRNISSKKIVEATITAPGRVQVRMSM